MRENFDPQRYVLTSSRSFPISKTDRIWRYLTFEKFVWLLETSKLYHTRLDLLGDPFEGSLTKAYVQQRDSGQLPEHLREGLPVEVEKLRNQGIVYSCFATCWHASPYETEAMWKLYSALNAGVAIVSTPLRMREAVNLTPYGHGMIGPVEYLDFDKDDMTLPMGLRARPGLLKRKSFAHERELRGLIYFINSSKFPTKSSFSSLELFELIRSNSPSGISVHVDLNPH